MFCSRAASSVHRTDAGAAHGISLARFRARVRMVHSGCGGRRVRASAIEFRLRMAINAAIVVLGFWSPWIEAWGIGRRISLMEWLALEASRTGLLPFTAATPAVIVLAALLAAAGAVLRLWGTAYLGPGVVNNLEMKAGAVV